MTNRAKESRPTVAREADSKAFGSAVTILSDLPDAVDVLNGVFVILVAHRVAGEVRYRRRVFLNLPAAQRAHDRAVQRGHAASLTLCKLAPTRSYGGGWSA